MALARYRSSADTVAAEAHLVPLPLPAGGEQGEVIGAWCGRRLHTEHLETIALGQGRWCNGCFVTSVIGTRPAPASGSVPEAVSCPGPGAGDSIRTDTYAGRLAAVVAYQRLDWPVTLGRHTLTLDLELDVDAVALAIPTALATETAQILTRRRCPPPVLAHPALPDHQVIIAGQRYPVPLGWPDGVYRATRTVLLPPSVTACGPVCWVRPPEVNALRLCREIDVITALRAASPSMG